MSRSSLAKFLNPIVFIITAIYFLLALSILVVGAFEANLIYGFRSVAACLIPFIILIFIYAYTPLSESGRRNPNFNLFFIYAVWTLMLMTLSEIWQFQALPLLELLLASTFASIFWRTLKPSSSSQLYACCYGIIVGVLGYVTVFGTSPI